MDSKDSIFEKAMDHINEKYIEEALEPEKTVEMKYLAQRNTRLGKTWIAVIAAVLVYLLSGAVILIVLGGRGNKQDNGLTDYFRKQGLSAEVVNDPVHIEVSERPWIPKEDMLKRLQRAESILDCTIEEINYLKIKEKKSGDVWYVTTMKLSLNNVIRGTCDQKQFTVVSVAVTNASVDFFFEPALENCKEKMRAAFVLKKVGDNDYWTIDGSKIPIHELGEYSAVYCMAFDGNKLQYYGYEILLSELD